MKRWKLTVLTLALSTALMAQSTYVSPTEGVLTDAFVAETEMKQDLLQMLANFATYLKADFQEAQAPNSVNEACGCFKGENTMGNNEQGVRPNADLSMICAFLVKYGKPAGVTLPTGVTWNDLETMAMKSLIFAYSTHKANKLKVCSGGNYWGSVSTSDAVWESSLWAMSVAYSAFFQWDKLTDAQKNYIYKLLKAECNYELGRSIPTGFSGDTKAEENGWEVDILAATLGLFPDDALAPQWYERMRQFAVNSYSHVSDARNNLPIDAAYDGKTPSDLYMGQNLYNDYMLQNHNMFHTSYQNVVMQELGEAALALKMFQLGTSGVEKWQSNALMHNNQEVMDHVLNWLATADGELAMPNGNDWSLFLFDQITSYSTQACFQRDPHALMLENLAYKNIKARQTTTADGSWLLRPDVGARRMGVEAHRVMMTYLMHEYLSTADLRATTWDEFRRLYGKTKYFPTQNIVRSMSKDRFTCFSWNDGMPDMSGVIVPNSVDKAKIMVPFRTHNTGNLLGVYSKGDCAADIKGNYALYPDAYAMNGRILTAGKVIPQAFCLYATSGNAVILLDALKANSATSVSSEQGGMMGISVDEFTNTKRTIYYAGGNVTTDGASYATWTSPWSNIDNYLGFVVTKHGETVTGAFGDKSNNNSINTAKIYPSYNGSSSAVGTSMNHIRGFIYYSDVTAAETEALAAKVVDLTTLPSWTEGWHGILAPDTDDTYYLLLTNLFASDDAAWENLTVTCPLGAPVFTQQTAISGAAATATFHCAQNFNIANELKVFVKDAAELTAVQMSENPRAVYLQNPTAQAQTVTVSIVDADGTTRSGSVTIPAGATQLVQLAGSSVTATAADFPGNYRNVAFGTFVSAGSYDGAHLPFSVIDGDADTYYQSFGSAASGTEHLTFALRNAYSIDKVVVEGVAADDLPNSIIVKAGMKENALTDVAGVEVTRSGDTFTLTLPATSARFVRLTFLGSGPVKVKNVGIYGQPSTSNADDPEAGTDVTALYLANPSFENDDIANLEFDNTRGAYAITAPAGWTLTGDRPDVVDIMTEAATATDNNFGTPGAAPDGKQMFYLRVGWSDKTTTLQTTSTSALPAGHYRLTFDYRSGYANSAASSFILSCGGSSAGSVTFNQGGLSPWTTASVDFTLAAPAVITPTIALTWLSGGSCILIDNFRLTQLEDDDQQPNTDLKAQIVANGGDATFLVQDPTMDADAGVAWQNGSKIGWLAESWRGGGVNSYHERTSNGTISQTLANMPAGTYKLVAALRAYDGGKITPRINTTSGDTFTGTGNANTTVDQIAKNGVQMPYDAERGFAAHNGTCHGWQWGSATATLPADGDLTLAFDMVGNSWMSVDDVRLYYLSDGTDTYCESVNAPATALEVTTTATVTADIIVRNPNTVIHSPSLIYTASDMPCDNNLVGNATMQNLVLRDGQPFGLATDAFQVARADYLRVHPDRWGTIILPYAVSSEADRLQFYQLVAADSHTLWFQPVDELPANTPAVFQLLGTSGKASFGAMNASAVGTNVPQGSTLTAAEGWTSQGFYQPADLTSAAYTIAADQFRPASTVAPFRAALLPAAPAADAYDIAIGDGTDTGVSRPQASSLLGQMYDLSGRPLPATKTAAKGIYILGGRKVVVK